MCLPGQRKLEYQFFARPLTTCDFAPLGWNIIRSGRWDECEDVTPSQLTVRLGSDLLYARAPSAPAGWNEVICIEEEVRAGQYW